jgi:predicted nucleotidyltransferase
MILAHVGAGRNIRNAAGNKMSNDNLFQRAKDLKLPIGKYVLFGSSPLGARRMRECYDIDILVTGNLWNEYKNNGWEVRILKNDIEYLWNDEIELYKNWGPGKWNIEQLIKEADIIDGLPFVKLEYVLKWKKLLGRKKDLKDVKLIEKFLKEQK